MNKEYALIGVSIALSIAAAAVYFGNVYKLTQCDFVKPYRCEIVHGIGLVGPPALVTVWADTDLETVEQ